MTPPENDVADEAVVAPPAAVRQLTGRRAARALAQARLRLVVPGRLLAPWEPPEANGPVPVPGAFGRPAGYRPPARQARQRAAGR